MTELSQKDLMECSFCLNITYAKLRVQNKTLTQITQNYLLTTYDMGQCTKDIVVITREMEYSERSMSWINTWRLHANYLIMHITVIDT